MTISRNNPMLTFCRIVASVILFLFYVNLFYFLFSNQVNFGTVIGFILPFQFYIIYSVYTSVTPVEQFVLTCVVVFTTLTTIKMSESFYYGHNISNMDKFRFILTYFIFIFTKNFCHWYRKISHRDYVVKEHDGSYKKGMPCLRSAKHDFKEIYSRDGPEIQDFDGVHFPFVMYLLCEMFLGSHFRLCAGLFYITLELYGILSSLYDSKTKLLSEDQYAKYIGHLMMETSYVIFFREIRISKENEKLAIFHIDSTYPIIKDCRVFPVNLRVEVNVETKIAKNIFLCPIDNSEEEKLDLKRALLYIAFILTTTHHLMLHTCASRVICPFPWKNLRYGFFVWFNTIISLYYNHLGHEAFYAPRFDAQESQWLEDLRYHVRIKARPPQHHKCSLKDIMEYSDLVNFVMKLRPEFLRRYHLLKRYVNTETISLEAYFNETITHSIDHYNFSKLTMLYYNDIEGDKGVKFMLKENKFAVFTGIGCVMPFCYIIPTTYQRGMTPFHKQVYEVALKINPELADIINTCIQL